MSRYVHAFTVVLIALLALAGFATAAVEIPKAGTVTLDGDLGEFAEAPKLVLSSSDKSFLKDAKNSSGDKDLSAIAYLMWDQEFLYVGAKVVDDDWTNKQTEANLWNGDAVEAWINGNQVGVTLLNDASDPAACCWKGSMSTDFDFVLKFVDNIGNDKDMEAIATSVKGAGGYVVEAAIPWQNTGVEAKAGTSFKLAIGVDDADDGSARLAQIYYPITWKWGQVNTFADAVLK